MTVEYEGFNIKGDGKFGYHTVHRKGAGTLPKILGGFFTTPTEAKKAIDRCLASKEMKPNDKAKGAARV